MSNEVRGGAIINMASVNAGIAIPGFVPYAMTKAAIKQITRNSAVDLGRLNIRYGSCCPVLSNLCGLPLTFYLPSSV